MLRVLAVKAAKVTHPTGDPAFKVLQSFPAVFTAEEVSPFLMMDHFGPMISTGLTGEDEFMVPWHPHRGQDLLSYMITGNGRHADSMGNRETFASPGIQWISAGSGIEHAEGGGNEAGVAVEGFQIWTDVPRIHKLDDPSYGTHGPEALPVIPFGEGASVRLLAGALSGQKGPFNAQADLMIADVTIESASGQAVWEVPAAHNTVLVYAFNGSGSVCGSAMKRGQVAQLDGKDTSTRTISFTTTATAATSFRALVFTGKSLEQPIAWHGPFVMTTDAEIKQTLRDYQNGTFLRVRATYDYKSFCGTILRHAGGGTIHSPKKLY